MIKRITMVVLTLFACLLVIHRNFGQACGGGVLTQKRTGNPGYPLGLNPFTKQFHPPNPSC